MAGSGGGCSLRHRSDTGDRGQGLWVVCARREGLSSTGLRDAK